MEQIRSAWISRSTEDRSELVHDLVRATARACPDRPAVVDHDGAELSYLELFERWRRAIPGLRGLGVRAEVPVAVWLERSPDLITSMLAIFEAGGVYAPIDQSCPPQRFAAIVADLRAPVLLADREPPREVRESGIRILHPGDLVRGSGSPGSAPPAGSPSPDNLAYVLSTSGSTGAPKWVAMPHRGLARLIRWQAAAGPAGLVTASFTATGFDVFFQEALSTLATGGRLCLVGEDARRDPETFLGVLEKHGIERVFLPYVALERLALAARRSGRVPSRLRHVVTAGERLVITEAIRELFARLPDCRLDNHYGPTETHLVTSMTLDERNRPWPEIPSIGSAVGSSDPYLLGENLHPADAGEIFVGGDAVARGYLNAPALTAERFLPDPFSPVPGSRMYRTGDVARLESDGLLHFLGRSDEQVKVRGYRIEPAEVELALSRHPGIRQAAVGVRELTDGVRGLVAYLVAEGASTPVSELSGFLARSLPGYMIPSRFVFLDALPLTSSGKVDRGVLATVPLREAPAPATDTESLVESVAAIWRRVLGHDEFDVVDDFFDVGGDSMLAAWVTTELGQLTGREVGLSLLLEDSTVLGLARGIGGAAGRLTGARPPSEIITLRPGPAGRVLFLFHALGGEVLPYRELARRITAPLRVLGVRWAGGPGAELSLTELAAVHCGHVRMVQPAGPYLLAGWSFGGVLALEVARQLRAAGQEVEFLGLLDANPVRDPITGLPPARTPYLAMLTKVLAEIDRRGLAGEAPVDVAELSSDRAWVGLMGGSAATGLMVGHLRHNLAVACQALAALGRYVPRPYAGDVHLFQADAQAARTRRELAAELRRVVEGQVRVRDVPGDHNSMLAVPQVTALAEAIDLALESIEKAGVHREP